METMTLKSPVGPLKLVMEKGCLTSLVFMKGANGKRGTSGIRPGRPAASWQPTKSPSAQLRNVCDQLEKYFFNPEWKFDVPVQLDGTDFQKRVWRGLRRIKPGSPLTYGELARKLKTGPRAIGGACRANPVPLIVPCHRVIAANSQGGFCGETTGFSLVIKDWLLEHEGAVNLA